MNRQLVSQEAHRALRSDPEAYWPRIVLDILTVLREREKQLEAATVQLARKAMPDVVTKRVGRRTKREVRVNLPS